MAVRKVGVEEELLLIDPETKRGVQVSSNVVRSRAQERRESIGEGLEQELFRSQLELATSPHESLAVVDAELRACRREAAQAAGKAGAAIVAVGTQVLDDRAVTTAKPRYERMMHEFGETARRTVVMGFHVHVDVTDDERVPVIDGMRQWLPVLLALSGNSPFSWGTDTGYASWRSQVWGRWPTAGPTELFGDFATYERTCDELIATGAALDRGMLYFDARIAERYPTVELRVADVCTEVDDAVLVTALSRALVDTVARDWATGRVAEPWRADLVRAATWRAGRYGIGERLVHPVHRTLAPAREVVEALMAYTGESLEDAGDGERVAALFEQLVSRGAGAARQRAVAEATGSLEAVVEDLGQRTVQAFAEV